MATTDLINFNAALRDLYPQPGERLKQWVVDMRREHKWESETCPRVAIEQHDDNTGTECRNWGAVLWTYLDHDCCSRCGELHEASMDTAPVVAWLAERAKRPRQCEDHGRWSDEFQPDIGPNAAHVLLRHSR